MTEKKKYYIFCAVIAYKGRICAARVKNGNWFEFPWTAGNPDNIEESLRVGIYRQTHIHIQPVSLLNSIVTDYASCTVIMQWFLCKTENISHSGCIWIDYDHQNYAELVEADQKIMDYYKERIRKESAFYEKNLLAADGLKACS